MDVTLVAEIGTVILLRIAIFHNGTTAILIIRLDALTQMIHEDSVGVIEFVWVAHLLDKLADQLLSFPLHFCSGSRRFLKTLNHLR